MLRAGILRPPPNSRNMSVLIHFNAETERYVMANFKISPTNALGVPSSVSTALGSAFSSDSAAADTLTVDVGAYLISSDASAGSAGALLGSVDAWTATINGVVFGADGINVAVGNAAVSTITVGATGNVTASVRNGIVTNSSAVISNSGTIVGVLNGISIEGGTAISITNAGSIIGPTNAILDTSGLSNDTISNTGYISGNVTLAGGANKLTNNGSISGAVVGGADGDDITNTKVILQQIELGAGSNRLVNSGSIGKNAAGISVLGGATGVDSITNSGSTTASLSLQGGTNVLLNSGTVGRDANWQSVAGGGDVDIITNTKTLVGGVNLGAGVNKLANSGTVGKMLGVPSLDGVSYAGAAGSDGIVNSGRLIGGISAGDGINSVSNYGIIGIDANGHSIDSGSGADTISNAVRAGNLAYGGTISGGIVTGDGGDTVNNYITFGVTVGGVLKTVVANGRIGGVVDLGAGSDKFNGGDNAEIVKDGDNADIYKLGNGNDRYIATGATAAHDGIDIVDGGGGLLDLYDARAAVTGGVVINLDVVAHSEASVGSAYAGAGIASGIDISGQVFSNAPAAYDKVSNIERAFGTQFADVIFGSSAANELAGNAGDDHLWGYAGNDQLNGGTGADTLIGGAGADTLAGGADDDVFVYFAASDSGVTDATRDYITDFVGGAGGDVIDVSRIDANSITAGNGAFTFIGTNVAWDGVAGELRATWTTIGQVIEGDINGDKVADFSIAIIDVGHSIDLSNLGGVDFVL
jgi:hypothetical protein